MKALLLSLALCGVAFGQLTLAPVQMGYQGVPYSQPLTPGGGTAPYTCTLLSGGLPAGTALTGTGSCTISGTPTFVTTYNPVIQATDSLLATGSLMYSISIEPYDGLPALPASVVVPTLPQAFVAVNFPTGNTLVPVHSGANLQTALNSVTCGQTLVLDAGATWTGNYIAPATQCTGGAQIGVISSAMASLPGGAATCLTVGAACQIQQSQAALTATIMTPNTSAALSMAQNPGPAGWYFAGIEFTVSPGASLVYFVVLTSSGPIQSSQVASNIIFDRILMNCNGTTACIHGFQINSNSTAIINSNVWGMINTSNDAQAILGCNGNQTVLISNNYLEGSGENVMFGGCELPTPLGLKGNNSDITVTHNNLAKQASWHHQLFPNGATIASGSWTNTSGSVWQAALGTVPLGIFFNGTLGTVETSTGALTAPNEWYWAASLLYVYATANPATAYAPSGVVIAQQLDIKNNFECKMCLRVLVNSNIASNAFPQGQGVCLSVNSFAGQAVQDVTYSDMYCDTNGEAGYISGNGQNLTGLVNTSASGNLVTYISGSTCGANGTTPCIWGSAAPNGVLTGWVNTSGNFWSKTGTTQTITVDFNGVAGTQEGTEAAMTAPGEWYWNPNAATLEVYSVGNPATTYAPGGVAAYANYINWVGNTITVNGLPYTITGVPTSQTLTVTPSPGNQTGVAFTILAIENTARIMVRNLLETNVSGNGFAIDPPLSNVTMDHVTLLNTGSNSYLYNAPAAANVFGYRWTNNIIYGAYQMDGVASGAAACAVAGGTAGSTCASPGTSNLISNNVAVGDIYPHSCNGCGNLTPSYIGAPVPNLAPPTYSTTTPVGNTAPCDFVSGQTPACVPLNWAAVGFVDYAGGAALTDLPGLALSSGSAYKGAGTDGADPGANITMLLSMVGLAPLITGSPWMATTGGRVSIQGTTQMSARAPAPFNILTLTASSFKPNATLLPGLPVVGAGFAQGYQGGFVASNIAHFIPWQWNVQTPHGTILAYNGGPTGNFQCTAAPCANWSFFDMSTLPVTCPGYQCNSNSSAKGFVANPVFDGTHWYLFPDIADLQPGFAPVLARYNGLGITNPANYDTIGLPCRNTFDPSCSGSTVSTNTGGATASSTGYGWCSGVFDGQFVYYFPTNGGSSGTNTNLLRYDTTAAFTVPNLSHYDLVALPGGALNGGFESGAYDGRQKIYMLPTNGGDLVVYDKTLPFTSTGSYKTLNFSHLGTAGYPQVTGSGNLNAIQTQTDYIGAQMAWDPTGTIEFLYMGPFGYNPGGSGHGTTKVLSNVIRVQVGSCSPGIPGTQSCTGTFTALDITAASSTWEIFDLANLVTNSAWAAAGFVYPPLYPAGNPLANQLTLGGFQLTWLNVHNTADPIVGFVADYGNFFVRHHAAKSLNDPTGWDVGQRPAGYINGVMGGGYDPVNQLLYASGPSASPLASVWQIGPL